MAAADDVDQPVPLPTRDALPQAQETRWSRRGRWRVASFIVGVLVLVLALVLHTSDRDNFTRVILSAGLLSVR